MPVFRSRLDDWLKARDKRGPMPIFVADPAFVDKTFWTRMRLFAKRGALVITRTKVNMNPILLGSNAWDPAAPANQGVLADESVGFDGSCVMRRIRYRDPETGVDYEFLTTVKDLAPGLIALIYLLRWRIEKVFDTGKNKLQETKAWAVGTVAQQIQAHAFALTHNLMMLLRRHLDLNHGLREVKIENKRETALVARQQRAARSGRTVASLHSQLPAVVQLTVQFIRTLRNGILAKLPWRAALVLLRPTMMAYL
jgi:hypothetical protein